MSGRFDEAGPLLAGYALAAAVGAGANYLGLPLAWILGPLATAAVLSIAGVELSPPVVVRRLGQIVIGSAIGVQVTAAVTVGLLGWLPLMMAAALLSVLASALIGPFLVRMARIDSTTAFFALIPGGLSEMGNVGAGFGAQPEPIALSQALRIALAVSLLPVALVLFSHAAAPTMAQRPTLGLDATLLLFAGGAGAALLARRLGLNNPWMIGALLFAGTFASVGFATAEVPRPVFFAAQLLLGFAIGARFRRSVLVRLPRLVAGAALALLVLNGVLLALAALLAALTPFDIATLALATSSGGMAEMATTATVLGLDVATVSAFHIVRAILINAFAGHYFLLLTRLGFFVGMNRLVGRLRR